MRSRPLLMVGLSLACYSALSAPPMLRAWETGRMSLSVVQINEKVLMEAKPGDRLRLPLPGGVVADVAADHVDWEYDIPTFIGHFADYGPGAHVVLTRGRKGWIGFARSPVLEWRFESTAVGRTTFRDVTSGIKLVQRMGFLDVAPVKSEGKAALREITATDAPVSATDSSTIDLMVVYTPQLAAVGDPNAIVKNMVATANQAYADSGIKATLRAVYVGQVNYQTRSDNHEALDAMAYSWNPDIAKTDPRMTKALANIKILRNLVGADVVVMVRPLDMSYMQSCGLAYQGGQGGQDMAIFYETSFAVVGYGTDQNGGAGVCTDYTFAHEVSHVLGSTHDRANAPYQGAFPFSYGYGYVGRFGTLMSYLWPSVGLYSSPKLRCGDASEACGIAAGNPGEADNVESLNQTRSIVAGYRPTKVTNNWQPSDCIFDWAESQYSALLGGSVTSQTGGGYRYRYYPESGNYVGVKGGRVYFYDGQILSDLGPDYPYLEQAASTGCR